MHNIEIKISNKFVTYESSVEFMRQRVIDIQNQTNNELIWFLEHDHIYTQGTSASDNEIIKKNNVKIIKSNRGGKTTYHGPGQRIIYFLIDLRRRGKDIRKFVDIIEKSLIIFLKNYNIESKAFKDRVGIWVTNSEKKTLNKERKIGAIGLRISKWITYHGLSFNINPNMNYFNFIHSCGLKDYKNTSLRELGVDIKQEDFDRDFKEIFLSNLDKF